ncbi:hypothetical protein O181_019435 [Austropuccinia psidii MF-1]|uniref:FMP27 GFWDK domain-containing protein n=1 Tax=Austropuccinia psidii MF-1 TaxID=1389203 RepID=A0A9Q3CAL8_9BASI|nr:hypothetical protein [Austropuccinia psidii MF-1]
MSLKFFSFSQNHVEPIPSSRIWWPPTTSFSIIATILALNLSFFYIFVPRWIRKYAVNFKIGKIGFLSLSNLEWRGRRVWVKGKGMVMRSESISQLEEFGVGERTQVTLASAAIRFGSNEGLRRQWIALRLNSIRIKVPKAHMEPYSPAPSNASECEPSNSELKQQDRSRRNSNASSASKQSLPADNHSQWMELLKVSIHNSFKLPSTISNYLPHQLRPLLRFCMRLCRLFRIKIIRPLLSKINSLGRRLSWIISVFGLEINDIDLEIDEICRLQCSIKIGFQLLRGENSQLCCWMMVKKLKIAKVHDTVTSNSRPKETFDRAQDDMMTLAFSLPGSLEISANAGLNPAIGLASIVASKRPLENDSIQSIAFSPTDCYAKPDNKSWRQVIRPHSINVKLTISEVPRFKKRSPRKTVPSQNFHSHGVFIFIQNIVDILNSMPLEKSKDLKQTSARPMFQHPRRSPSYSTSQSGLRQPLTTKLSLLSVLRVLQVEIPSLYCCYWLSSPPTSTSPYSTVDCKFSGKFHKQVFVNLEMFGFASNLDFSAEKSSKRSNRSSAHVEWFGLNAAIPLRFDFRWKEVNLSTNAFSDIKDYRPLGCPNPKNLLKIAETSCVLSSSWAPKAFREKIAPLAHLSTFSSSHLKFTGDHNDHMIVIEFEMGKIIGQAHIDDFELILTLARNISALASDFNLGSPKVQQDVVTKVSLQAPRRDLFLPKFVLGLFLHSISFDLYGPQQSTPLYPRFESAYQTNKGHRNTWCPKSIFSIGFSAFHFNSTGEYVDLTLKRSDPERRHARNLARKNEIFVPKPLRNTLISRIHEEIVLKERHPIDSDFSSLNQNQGSIFQIPVTGEPKGNQHRRIPPYSRAYPLPNPPTPQHWKSRVEIFRAMDSIDFLYQVSCTWKTQSIDVIFYEANHNEKSSSGSPHIDPSVQTSPTAQHKCFYAMEIQILSDLSFCGSNSFSFGDLVPMIDFNLREGTVQTIIGDVSVELSSSSLLSSLMHLIQVVTNFRPISTSQVKPYVSRTHSIPTDLVFSLAMSKFVFCCTGIDSRFDPCIERGTKFEASNTLIECFRLSSAHSGLYSFPDRLRLDLQEDIRVQANAKLLQNPDFDACLCKCAIDLIELLVLPDVKGSLTSKHSLPQNSFADLYSNQSSSLWELKSRGCSISQQPSPSSYEFGQSAEDNKFFIERGGINLIAMKRFACRITLQNLKNCPNNQGDELIVALENGLTTFRIDAFRIYCTLLSISTLLNLAKGCSSKKSLKPHDLTNNTGRLYVGVRADFSSMHIHIFLSHKVPIFVQLRRVSFQKSARQGFDIRWDTLLLAGRSVTYPSLWDDLLKVKTCKIKAVQINPSKMDFNSGPVNRGWHRFLLIIEGDAARLHIPYKFIMAEILENVSILVKTSKQLYHRLVQGCNESILQPVAESAKKLPEIRIKFRIICVQAEDDPFENKLNAIRRAGKEEVKERLARDESFQQMVQNIKATRKQASGDPLPRCSWESEFSELNTLSSSVDEDASFDSSYFSHPGGFNPQVPVDEALYRLHEYNAASWIKRIRNALAEQERQEDGIQRQLYGHAATKVTDTGPIPMRPTAKATPLVRVVFNSIQVALFKAEFEKNETGLADYLYRVGKGLPRDTKFSLIVPMHISWQMEGATIKLRDFPLHLFSLPRPQAQNGASQERELPQYTWQFESDFVIAEEMCGIESILSVPSLIVPSHYSTEGKQYAINIPKGVMPIKSYADPMIKIQSTVPVRLGWGNSMQPAVQDMMRVIDSISKPPVDLSDRLGFWDKVRLVLHWTVEINFIGSKADVVLHLKGSRDPYELLGCGAGFAKVWRGNVKILLGYQNKEQEFLQIRSDQYILGIPNLKDLINNAATGSTPVTLATPATQYKRVYRQELHASESDESHSEALSTREIEFIKIIGKLTNGVRWGMGIILERACVDSPDKTCSCQGSAFHRKCRIFTFKPHYLVITKAPPFTISLPDKRNDSYQGFRSDFIHFSISLTSPTDGSSRQKRPSGQNSLYFSSEAFTHFWSWWKTFDSALVLPIRQGSLFSSAQSPSKKFGRHVATIKYHFGISPLFLAHTYRYESASDWVRGHNTVLGFKAKISRFNVDLHARAIETTIRKPEMKKPQHLIRKAFYQAEIDCQEIEIRAISAVFHAPRRSKYAADIGLAIDQDDPETNSILEEHIDADAFESSLGDAATSSSYLRNFQENDVEWIDLNDFSDLYFWPNVNHELQPKIKVFECISCPHISFIRRPSAALGLQSTSSTNASVLDWESATDGQTVERTKFGKEDTHTCFVGQAEDSMMVQVRLLDSRFEELEAEKRRCLLNVASYNPPRSEDTLKISQIAARIQTLKQLKDTMLNANKSFKRHLLSDNETEPSENYASTVDHETGRERYLFEMTNQISDENSEWSNRLLVHNPLILISNTIRDILLKYYYSYVQRQGFIYHISARAVKFILDLADPNSSAHKLKPDFAKRKTRARSFDYRKSGSQPGLANETQSTRQFPENDSEPLLFDASAEEQAERDLPNDLFIDPADLILLMRPQIAFRSEVDEVSTVILTAFYVQLKSFEILDSLHIDDPINAKVMRRNFGAVCGFQMFYPSHPLSNSVSYSSPRPQSFGKYCFVPIEVLVDLKLEPWGFDRLIGPCNVNIAHDSFNQLRIKCRTPSEDWSFSAATQPHLQTSTDLLRVEAAEAVSVHATATHYRAIYNVVTDLCFYTDPAQKKRNASLETMQFAYDVDDLAGMAKQIQGQQAQIRLYRNKIVEEYADLNVYDELQLRELTHREYLLWLHASDLNLMVEAIRRSQGNSLGRCKADTHNLPGFQLLTYAKSITWYMLTDSGEAIAKLSITDTRFVSYKLPDTSVSNRLLVQDMLALNISADTNRQFDEILSRYGSYMLGSMEEPKHFLKVVWKTLPPIAGISIVESFLLEIHPIRLQVEHTIGVKMHEYLFSYKTPTAENDQPEEASVGDEAPTSRKLRKTRSIANELNRSRGHVTFPEVITDDKRSIFGFSAIHSAESYSDLMGTNRLRLSDSPGLLYPDWRSTYSNSICSSRRSRAASIRSNSSDGCHGGHQENPNILLKWNKQKAEEATEMKKRAQLYKSFLFIDVIPTILCVSYSGPKYPDIFDLVVKVPPFHFESRIWSYSEFFDEIRRACVSSLFKQSPSILGQIITTARKNTSVPKRMGQKMASGLKFKKLSFFERGDSPSSSQSNASTLGNPSKTTDLGIFDLPRLSSLSFEPNPSSPLAHTVNFGSNGFHPQETPRPSFGLSLVDQPEVPFSQRPLQEQTIPHHYTDEASKVIASDTTANYVSSSPPQPSLMMSSAPDSAEFYWLQSVHGDQSEMASTSKQ